MAATTEKVRELLDSRLTELDDEKARVKKAIEALGSTNGRRPVGRPKGSRGKRVPGGRSGQALKMIASSPGITASEIARKMKIKPNYLYRLLTELQKQGKVKKDGRRYFTKVK